MFLISLALGSLAIIFPFLALVLLMLFLGRNIRSCLEKPMQSVLPAFIIPISIMVISPAAETLLMVSDAVLGVCFVALIFINVIKHGAGANMAFLASSLCLMLYGALRAYFFKDVTINSFEMALQSLQDSGLFALGTEQTASLTLEWMRLLLPSIWTIQMLVALFTGFVIFLRQAQIPFSWSRFAVNKYYSLIVLVFIPFFWVNNADSTLINGLIAFGFVPFIQGLGVILFQLQKLILNPILIGLILFIVLMNLSSIAIIALLGIADQWLDIRKIEPGGITDENHTA